VHRRREEERRIRDAPSDDDVGAGGERLDDRLGAEVRIRRQHAVAEIRERASGFVDRQVASLYVVVHIVANDCRNLEPVQTQLSRDVAHQLRRGHRVRGAGVRDHLYAALCTRAEHRAHARREQRIITELWIAPKLLLRERNRTLGETLEHEIVERPVLGQLHRGLDAVARVAGTTTDPDGSHFRRH
jgi:hypothetical protein